MARHRPDLALVHALDAAQPPRPSAEATRIRVVIAHGHGLVRAGFRAVLEGSEHVTVVGEAADGDQAIALARRTRPTVLLIDLALPGQDGLEVVRRVAAAGVHVVLVSGVDTEELVLPALRAGATGVLLESDAGAAELVEAVRAVAAGDAFLSPSVVRQLINEFAATPAGRGPLPEQLEELTPRELEVVALVAGGMTNHEIAEYLVLSPATAKTHVSRALCKLQARDRSQLVRVAYEAGLVVPRAAGANAPRPMAAQQLAVA
jgi:DNA-binding NarL/FixJ family response regulator